MKQIWTAKEKVIIDGVPGFNFVIRDMETNEVRKSFIDFVQLDMFLDYHDILKPFRDRLYTIIPTPWRFLKWHINQLDFDGNSVGLPDWNPLDPNEYPWD